MTGINTNIGALLARTNSARAEVQMARSMQRLSSGLRINSAADDAAGLAVANKMASQQRGMEVAMRNAKDGASLVATAESGISAITSMVLRMRELAIQMDNGVYTSADRDAAQLELNALIAEIDKIAANTRYNDVALLDGTYDQNIRTGNSNSETTRIVFNSMFASQNGLNASIREHEDNLKDFYHSGSDSQEFTLDPTEILKSTLGIEALPAVNASAGSGAKNLSDVLSDANFSKTNQNVLLLKDNLNGLGYVYAAVQLTDAKWEQVSSNLLEVQALLEELNGLDPSKFSRATEIFEKIEKLEIERSRIIGSQFHANEIKETAIFMGENGSNSKYAELLNIYTGSGEGRVVADQIAAIEVEFTELATTLHDPRVCEHCIAGSAQYSDVGGAIGGAEGVDSEGNVFAYAQPDYTTSGSGSETRVAPSSSAISPLVSGKKWASPGTDADDGDLTNALTYSYWDGGAAPYNYTEGTRTTLESHGTGNETAHNEVFTLWDAVSPFSLDEVPEDGDGDPVGDLRVAFTDGVPSGSAAFAYYPSNSAKGGDIYYSTTIDTNGNTVDFVEGEYNWVTALHEIGHALGLSHPFDGGSTNGSTLNLNLDFQRNTVMTYVQRDRNYLMEYTNGSGTATFGTQRTHTSTPGLLDIEAIEYIYGSAGWIYNSGDNNVYGDSTDGFATLDNSYDGIRTIVDSGGDGDTLDASGVTTTGSIINLTPGTYSSINYYATNEDKINAVVTDGNQTIKDFFVASIATFDALASASNDHYSAYSREALYRGQDNVAIAHNTWIENAKGGDGDDTITGNNKGNEITGNGGDDAIDGGGGVDAAIYSEAYANYSLSNSGTSVTISHTGGAANEGTDTLTNIEYIKFSDGYYDVASSAFNSGVALPGLSGTETGGQTGGVSYGAGSANLSGMSLKDISLATQLDSKGAITILNKTLEEISAARSTLGAVMNRMQHSIASQSEASMMSQQSRGRVVSSDLATESTQLAQQAILSMAAQQAINMATQRRLTILALLDAL